MFAFIFRIILFLVAISVIKAVIRAVQSLFSPPRQAHNPGPPKQTDSRAGATVLQQDPVCGTYVAIDTSLKKVVGGKVVHFCSPECRERYAG